MGGDDCRTGLDRVGDHRRRDHAPASTAPPTTEGGDSDSAVGPIALAGGAVAAVGARTAITRSRGPKPTVRPRRLTADEQVGAGTRDV